MKHVLEAHESAVKASREQIGLLDYLPGTISSQRAEITQPYGSMPLKEAHLSPLDPL